MSDVTDSARHATETASRWLNGFAEALAAGDYGAVAAMFADECYWRDLVAFTWNITTMEGREAIREMLETCAARTEATNWSIDGEASETDGVVEAWIDFETAVARGRGHLRLKGDKAFTLLTTAQELKGYEEKKGRRRINGAVHGVHRERKTWKEEREAEASELGYTRQPYCVVVGGGQAGLAIGARLRRLGVPTIIVDKHPKPGDQWRKRYKSLCLHDPVWYDHMPYLPFPDDWPVFAPKDKLGDWLEMYARVMELNFWGSTEAKRASYDEAKREWTVVVDRDGEEITLKPKQLILATGMSGVPNMPSFPGMERFRGDQHHSSQHPGGEVYRGKRCVVVGSNNSAFDICADLWEHRAAEVTMVQRSSTHIMRSETLVDLYFGEVYSEKAIENGITTDIADMMLASVPYRIMHVPHYSNVEETKRRDADLYERLEKVGFLHDFGDDETGLSMKYMRRGSGYYIDVGASELIADGKVKLKSGVTVEEIQEHSIVLSDGTELPADLIVYATGYGSMNGWAAQLISQEVADKVGKVWGLGSATTKDPGPWEGEQRNMWKPTRQQALWLHGGNLHQSRHYSQFLALQIKAREVGIPTPVYKLAEVHHIA